MIRYTRTCALLLCATLAGTLSACAAYRKCGWEGCPGDRHISSDVRATFNQYPELEPPNLIYIQTLDHIVYLTGQVNTEPERDLAGSLAKSVAGVDRVVNSINLEYQGH